MSTLPEKHDISNTTAAVEDMNALSSVPAAETGKALINFLMQDKFFLALFRSNDPSERAKALDKLNKAHYQAYGD